MQSTNRGLFCALLSAFCVAAAAFHYSPEGLSNGVLSFDYVAAEKAQTIDSVAGRRLLQESSCFWDATTETCVFSVETISSAISNSDRPLAQFFSKFLTCQLQGSESDCNNVGFCQWVGACAFVDFAADNENSACVQNAPSTIAYFAALSRCPHVTDQSSCDSSTNCFWDAEQSVCVVAFLQLFFGLEETSTASVEESIDRVAAAGDREFIETLLSCLEQATESACTGTCLWQTATGSCVASFAAVLQAITVDGDFPNDGVCQYFSLLEGTGCSLIGNADECRGNEACTYEESCGTDISFFVLQVSDDDPTVEETLTAAATSCEAFTTAEECS